MRAKCLGPAGVKGGTEAFLFSVVCHFMVNKRLSTDFRSVSFPGPSGDAALLTNQFEG